MSRLLTESRKYGIGVVLSAQTLGQFAGEDILVLSPSRQKRMSKRHYPQPQVGKRHVDPDDPSVKTVTLPVRTAHPTLR